jgi:hypothetical protein
MACYSDDIGEVGITGEGNQFGQMAQQAMVVGKQRDKGASSRMDSCLAFELLGVG